MTDWPLRIARASALLGVPPARLLSRRRDAPTARARHAIAGAMLRCGLSSVAVGRLLGRHHSAILHARDEARPSDVARVLAEWA